ncbi:MAG: ComEC/Rec2 family competence protein [Atopobiaceae bacterium]|nr:ComEC/Rec2 family competence protein [Atopobiaceae bacterium]
MESSSVSRWGFEALSDALPTQSGFRCRARMFGGDGPSGVIWLSCAESLERGDVVWGVGRYAPNADDEWGRASRMQGVWGSVRLVVIQSRARVGGPSGILLNLRRAIRQVLDPKGSDGRAVLAGCLIADRRFLVERDLDDLFAQCGVAHLVAVSGSHLVVVSSFVARALDRLRLEPTMRVFVLIALTGAFVVLCGAPASAVRAWLMSSLADGGRLLGRRGDAVSSVSVVALSMTLMDPALSGQAGFLLSVTCVLALSLYSRYVAYLIGLLLPDVRLPRSVPSEVRIRLRSCHKDVVDGIAASLVCLVASLPLVMSMKGSVSLVGPLLGLPLSALISLGMSAGLAGACLSAVFPAGRVSLSLAEAFVTLALRLMGVASQAPLTSIVLGTSTDAVTLTVLLLAVAVLVVWPLPTARTMRTVLFLLLGLAVNFALLWTVFAPARICVLDVGQGDAILVQDGWHAILVDTGPDGSVAKALARKHVLRLDAVVLTHLHDDHYGGVDDLVGVVPCGRVIVAQGVAVNVPPDLEEGIRHLTGKPCEEVSYKDVIRVGGFALEVVWPHGAVVGDANPDSLILAVSYQGKSGTMSALLTGDAEEEELDGLIASGDLPDVDVLKVGHHGSETSIRLDQARLLDAELAVASAGKDNSYGHPKEECVQNLTEAGTRFLCTIDAGDVEIRPTSTGVACLTTKGGYRPSSTMSFVKVMSGSAPLLRSRSQRAQAPRTCSRLPAPNLRAQPR